MSILVRTNPLYYFYLQWMNVFVKNKQHIFIPISSQHPIILFYLQWMNIFVKNKQHIFIQMMSVATSRVVFGKD
jgi:hypothetical protein